MAATPEAKVKRVVVAQLKELGAYYFYPVTGGYGRSGVPDIVGCYRGRFFAFECKAGANKPTALQQKNLDEITATGGFALVVNEVNMHSITSFLSHEAWDQGNIRSKP
jgi:Holliday junction resolvase